MFLKVLEMSAKSKKHRQTVPRRGHAGEAVEAPFGSHFGSILGLRSHFGSILGPTWGSRSTSGQLTPFWDQFWSLFGTIFGSNLGPKSSPKTRANLRPFPTPFWDQFWSHFGTKIGPISMSFGSCAESPGAASPRDGFSLFSDTSDMAKSLKKPLVFDGFCYISGSRARDAKLCEMTPKCIQMGPKMAPKMVPKWGQKLT